jgi:hypothetical protein
MPGPADAEISIVWLPDTAHFPASMGWIQIRPPTKGRGPHEIQLIRYTWIGLRICPVLCWARAVTGSGRVGSVFSAAGRSRSMPQYTQDEAPSLSRRRRYVGRFGQWLSTIWP